jgi:hypothetical protein
MNGLLGWLLWVLMKWNEARGLNTELCLCGRTQSMEVLGGTEAGAGFKEAQLISPTLLRSKSVGDEWHTWKEILREMLPTTPADPWHLWGQEWYRRKSLCWVVEWAPKRNHIFLTELWLLPEATSQPSENGVHWVNLEQRDSQEWSLNDPGTVTEVSKEDKGMGSTRW